MVMLPIVALLTCGVAALEQPSAKAPKAPPPAATQAPQPTTVVSNSLGVIIKRGTEQAMEVVEERRGWAIRDGECKLLNSQLADRSHPVDSKLQVNQFAVTDDTVVVKVDVSPAARPDAFTKMLAGADKTKPPTLVDTKGRTYEAVGFVYQDDSITQVRYTKGQPLKGLGEAGVPSVSLSTPQRHLTLVFTVSLGAEVKEFRVGETVVEMYSPTVKCDRPQK